MPPKSISPLVSLWDGNVDGWRVWVMQYGDEMPFVTASRWEPKYEMRNTAMADPSPVKVRTWIKSLEAKE